MLVAAAQSQPLIRTRTGEGRMSRVALLQHRVAPGKLTRAMPFDIAGAGDMSISILVARRSALADLSTICVTIASRLVIVRRRPSIVMTTVSFSASASNAGGLLVLRPRQRLTFEAPQRPL